MSTRAAIRVVVVDDHEMFVEGLTMVLRADPSIDVIATAATIDEGCTAVQLHRPDVVLMDYGLPDGDGAYATERIKEEVPETQVVMVTSFDDESVLVRAIEAGCSGFITKHRAVQEVANAVRAA